MGRNNYMIIYQAYCPFSNSFYIGQTKNTLDIRKEQHKRHARRTIKDGSRFHAAIRKYGFENMQWNVLETLATKEELNEAEIRWIALLKNCGHRIYNITDGGGGRNGDGYWQGRKIPNDAKEKISLALKKYYENHEHSRKGKTGSAGWSKGLTKEMNESVKRIAESKMGKKMPQKVRDALMPKAKLSRIKTISCLSDGRIFNSITEAAKFYECSASGISRCCSGEYKTYKGLKFTTIYPQGWKKL
jgi:group I intron endonuclease